MNFTPGAGIIRKMDPARIFNATEKTQRAGMWNYLQAAKKTAEVKTEEDLREPRELSRGVVMRAKIAQETYSLGASLSKKGKTPQSCNTCSSYRMTLK